MGSKGDKYSHTNTILNGESTIVVNGILSECLQKMGIYWRIINVIPEKNLLGIVMKINKYVILIEVFTSVVAVILAIKLSSRIIRSIELMKKKLRNFGTNNEVTLTFIDNAEDDIWELEKHTMK